MDPSVIDQQIIDFVQSEEQKRKANFAQHAFNIKFELQNGSNKEFYKYPVNTKECFHIQTQELDSILKTKQCAICGKTINSYKDLVMDIRWEARKIMHPDTEIVTIFNGYIFHQYTRVKQFNEPFNQKQFQELIVGLFERKSEKNNFIELAKTDPQYNNAKPTDQLTYDAICQLDFVKIQIPVRHKNCKHAGCYELTSLLFYKTEVLDSDPNKKQIECLFKCQVKFNLNTLEQDLVLDHQLLAAIRKSRPHTIKFYINPQNNELIDEYSNNGNQDHYIMEFFKQVMKIIDVNKFKEFEKDVFKILKDIYSRKLSDLDKSQQKMVLAQSKLYEFQDQNLNLEDPFLKSKPIIYPVRCISCGFDKCSDIRTYIGHFLLNKKKKPTDKFQCPLCSKTFSKIYDSIQNHQFQDYIYLDQNLLKRLLEHREYIHTKTFKYEGRQYMLDEFKKRHKIFAADVKEQCEQYQKEYMEYDNLNCIVTGKRLKIPLQLYKCPTKYYVDFDMFYEEYKKIGYDLTKGLKFCKCQTCSAQPIVSMNNIFFDEFFQLALNKLQDYETQSRTTEQQQKITINVKTEELVGLNGFDGQQQLNQQSIIRPQNVEPRKPGFESISSEEDYQKCLDFFKRNDQYKAKVLKMTQNIGGINIVIDEQGVKCDIDEKQVQMNQAAQNDKFKQWGIKITNLKVEVKNDDLKMDSKIKFEASQQKK